MKINKTKFIRRSVLAILVVGAVSVYFANRFVKSKGFDGLSDFVSNYYRNSSLADEVEPKELEIKISKSDFDFIKKRRQEGLERGIQINDGNNYVPCSVIFDGDTVLGEMRLKGHMTDHLEGEKWSYRVKTERPIMGMYRFSLQHPGNRNYSYEWIYHQLLREEGVIALQYDFLNFTLNDNDLGIYAVEEHFGQHVLTSNDRPKGAIIRWNPGLYWEWRIDELQELYLDEEYSAFSSSFPEPYDRGVVFKDSVLTQNYLNGARQLELFRRGDKTTSEVFDVEKMAAFHAIIDLVGGHHSLDWSDVKFYFNSKTKKLEPIGYESFSIGKTERLAGQRARKNYEGLELDYHERLFADPVFFAAYIQALERICTDEYFNLFTSKIQSDLDQKIGVIAHEFPYIKFDYDAYYENIELIQHNLALPKPFHAFTEELTDSTVRLSLAPVSDFPIEVIALTAKGKRTYPLKESLILPAKPRESYTKYFSLTIPHDGKKMKDLKLKARIVGSSKEFEVEVAKYAAALSSGLFSPDTVDQAESYFDFLNDSIVAFKTKDVTVKEVIELPKGVSLKLFPGQTVSFKNDGALIIDGGRLQMWGSEEQEIVLMNESNSMGFIVKNGKVIGSDVSIRNSSGTIFALENSNLVLNSSNLSDSQGPVIFAERSELLMRNIYTGSLNTLGHFKESNLELDYVVAKNGENFIQGNGSEIRVRNSHIENYKTVVALKFTSLVRFWNCTFESNELISDLNFASSAKFYNCKIPSGNAGFQLDKETDLPGDSSFELTSTSASNLNQLEISTE